MDDIKLLELYFNRDEEAIKQTHVKYGDYCFAVANNILSNREDAEECVNDTYLKAWNSIPPQRPKVLRLFLARIARNMSLDRYEKRMTQKRGGGETELAIEELSECIGGSASVEGEIMKKELENTVKRFIKSLNERDRTVFLRRYFYLEPNPKIAQRLDMSSDSIAAVLNRIRKKLRKYLEKEGYFNERQ
ncbi:MAG: RNA polymerase sigma factor [Clostridiales bacterium]|nr:RNA polymerase sigma factor [Clostridiales bacterium]